MAPKRRRLTDKQVQDILASPRNSRVIAGKYGVSEALVRQIRLGLVYADVKPPRGPRPEWTKGNREGPTNGGARKGQQNGAAKLNDEIVTWLRAHGFDIRAAQEEVEKRFGVRVGWHTIYNAIRGRTWKHLPGAREPS